MASDKDRGNLIGGTWVTGNGAERTSHNPARDGEVVWRGHAADAAQAEQAIAAAHGAFAAWAARGYEGRRAILERLADVAAERTEELAQAITAEMGKPIREARGEAGSLPGKLRASIAAWENLPNVALAGAPGRALWRPHGVMAVIGPSNYPIHLMHTHVAPALLAGNTVVCKPSRVTPMSGQIYAEIMASIGLPEGVFNLLVGTREVGGVLVRHEDVHAIAFTGSWGGGRRIAEACLDQPRKLLALEMGGKNVAVVLDDAHLGQTVHELVLGATLTRRRGWSSIAGSPTRFWTASPRRWAKSSPATRSTTPR